MGHALCICSRGTITIENKRYYFIQKLDEGGFSYVDLVEGEQDGRFYALKRILCHDREGRSEAQQEVEMHHLISHPNVLSLTAHTFVDKGAKCEAWLLLPFIRKGSLWSELEKLRDKNSVMPESRILHIFQGICTGLQAIHDKGYAHRDLKPTNVLLDEGDRPLLMDLGSMNRARIEVKGSREAMTVQDWAAQRCTISYRAPELFSVESHCIIDERTDIWSLGCVLYSMMMLEGPFDLIFQKGDSVALAVQNTVTLPESCSRYSQGLQNLLTSIMVANPQERPDIYWVLNQLKHLQPTDTVQDTSMGFYSIMKMSASPGVIANLQRRNPEVMTYKDGLLRDQLIGGLREGSLRQELHQQPRPIEEAWETAFTICQRIRATIPTIGHTSTAHLASRCPVTVPALSEQMVWAKVADDFGGAEYCALVEHKDKDGQVEVARTLATITVIDWRCAGRTGLHVKQRGRTDPRPMETVAGTFGPMAMGLCDP
ncbi:Serine/threonine-protein kinase 16 [Acipenser ruthenus]|uniref:non-specific serine/threonine protein kinase n=1 Tax=Acipenser ruthenus TaxID=7906 RepID=A0A662YZ31_ACIRT|nr:Serine/threonine-protein kinase 16 [Acipenser ruthenus]